MTKDDYVSLSDVQTLWSEMMKPWIKDIYEYKDVYIGAAAASSTIIDNAYHHDSMPIGRPIAISNASGYIWVIMPSTYNPAAMMNGIEIPITVDSTITINEVSYKIWKSSNSYSGTFKIYLL